MSAPTPREAADLPGDQLAQWIVDRVEGPTSSRMRAGLLDDIEAAIGYRDHARAATPGDRDRGRELAEALDTLWPVTVEALDQGKPDAEALRALAAPQPGITREAVIEAVRDAETSAALDPSIDVALSTANRLGLTEEADRG